jgi:hypothetical protein
MKTKTKEELENGGNFKADFAMVTQQPRERGCTSLVVYQSTQIADSQNTLGPSLRIGRSKPNVA